MKLVDDGELVEILTENWLKFLEQTAGKIDLAVSVSEQDLKQKVRRPKSLILLSFPDEADCSYTIGINSERARKYDSGTMPNRN